MKRVFSILLLAATTSRPAGADSVGGISDSAELAAALAQARATDTLTLDADIEWNGPKPLALPPGVILDGASHTLANTTNAPLLDQVESAGVVLRNLKLTTARYLAWTVGVKNGDLRIENCDIRCRLIAWEKGALTLENCQVTIQMPDKSDHNEPVGVYGGGASVAATNCVFKIGWDTQHVGLGFFHNFGGNPASRLSVKRCTIIGAPDRSHTQTSRHLSVFLSDNSAGPEYETTVSDSIILAEVKSVFCSSGKGRVVSSHNNNAGMLRNPGILAGGNPLGTSFYQSEPDDNPVQDKSGDIEEFNPFVDAPNGDYRIVAGTTSATAASDGGPLGAKSAVIAKEMNAYNLDFAGCALVDHRTKGYREALFDGWPVHRDNDQQRCLMLEDGPGGRGMRLETWRNDEGTGGRGKLVTQNAYQSFVTIPGWQYTIRTSARRGRVPLPGAVDNDGAQAILGVADGYSRGPDELIASAMLDAPENHWCPVEVQVTAPSNRLTVHLIHRTNSSWNRVDWGRLSITSRAPVGTKVPAGLRGPVLGYINTIPPESEEARAARHKKVAERRANVPILVHRGAHKFDPENTLEAYDRVMALGADGIEIDPRMTKDGVMYTFHDDGVARMLAGDGLGVQMTYYELISLPFKTIKGRANKQTRVPTVVSVLQLARERAMLLHFDVKEAGIEDLLIGLLDRFDMWDHMVMVTPSPDSNRLRFHPKARLMEYKPNPDFKNPDAVKKALDGPGQMIFMDADPSPAVKGLGRKGPGDQPLPDGLRAWWWPDGSCAPVR